MFAFAIFNKETKELFIARDQWGIKPLYYGLFGKTFIFGSEIKAFIDDKITVKREEKSLIPMQEIKNLSILLQDGLITQEEFDIKKAEIFVIKKTENMTASLDE